MTKAEISSKVAEKTGLTKSQAEDAVNATLKAITEGLNEDGKVQFVGFGSFKKVHKPARVGRNPASGAPVEIPAKDVIKFTPSK